MSPTATQSTCVEEGSLCLTYPDYPVHIPTTTLPRRLSCNKSANLVGAAGKRKKKLTKKPSKKSSSSTSSSVTSGEEAGPAKKSQGRTEEEPRHLLPTPNFLPQPTYFFARGMAS